MALAKSQNLKWNHSIVGLGRIMLKVLMHVESALRPLPLGRGSLNKSLRALPTCNLLMCLYCYAKRWDVMLHRIPEMHEYGGCYYGDPFRGASGSDLYGDQPSAEYDRLSNHLNNKAIDAQVRFEAAQKKLSSVQEEIRLEKQNSAKLVGKASEHKNTEARLKGELEAVMKKQQEESIQLRVKDRDLIVVR